MKRIITSLCILFAVQSVFAADSTKVRSHDRVIIKTNPSKGFTEYPAKVGFPADSVQYRKAYMYLEFGCAPGLKCGEWDYLNHIFLEKDSVRYEIARYITPYGFYWNSGMNWKHGWYFDLTDFSSLLHDSVNIVYRHTGYEANNDRGWTILLDFTLVHGEAARFPMGMDQMHRLSAAFGNVNKPFDSLVKPVIITNPVGSDLINFKTIQTGHGMDQQENCAEFCSKIRTIKFDDKIISVEPVWRNNCGLNSLYPQAGTWIYDRAGWCPGAPVESSDVFQMVPDVQRSYVYSLEMEEYNNTSGGSANYMLTTYAQYFKDMRKQIDASLEDILTPSTHYDYGRINPTCGAPQVRVKNYGRDTIKSLDFFYGKQGGSKQIIWVPCQIPPFQSRDIVLEAIYNWRGSSSIFEVEITKVNGKIDEYPADNFLQSEIVNSPTYPNKIYIEFKSNLAPTENYYTLKDAQGHVVLSKNSFVANKIYRDTVYLENNICYTFEFFDDGEPPVNNPLNRDGLNWWANTADGSGYIQIRNGNTNGILKNFNADFGTKHLLNFYTSFSMSLQNPGSTALQLEVMPNPGHGEIQISYNYPASHKNAVLTVYDQTGRMVYQYEGNEAQANLILSDLAPGLYTASLLSENQVISKKFLIQ